MDSKNRSPITTGVYYITLTIASLLILLPFVWLISTSFDKVNTYALPFPPRMLPENPSVFNYEMALTNVPMLKYLSNTIIIVIMSLVFNLAIATFAGFCISKGKFPGKSVVLLFIMSNMMIPFESKLMPIYDVIRVTGLTNTFIGVILPGIMTNAMYIFFVKQFCDDLPEALYEAALIDGCSVFGIYSRVFLPLMKPVVATIAVLDVIGVWNDLLWPMIVLTKDNLYTIQMGLVRYNSSSSGNVHAGISTALSMISIIPLAIVFTFLQKYIVQSVAATGIKE